MALCYITVKNVLNFGSAVPAVFWTDYNIVLGCIKNETRRFRVFVENRVGLTVIRTLTNPDFWGHILSSMVAKKCRRKKNSPGGKNAKTK